MNLYLLSTFFYKKKVTKPCFCMMSSVLSSSLLHCILQNSFFTWIRKQVIFSLSCKYDLLNKWRRLFYFDAFNVGSSFFSDFGYMWPIIMLKLNYFICMAGVPFCIFFHSFLLYFYGFIIMPYLRNACLHIHSCYEKTKTKPQQI